jgi:hypothetical protein
LSMTVTPAAGEARGLRRRKRHRLAEKMAMP